VLFSDPEHFLSTEFVLKKGSSDKLRERIKSNLKRAARFLVRFGDCFVIFGQMRRTMFFFEIRRQQRKEAFEVRGIRPEVVL
jgi:hypothetical protein